MRTYILLHKYGDTREVKSNDVVIENYCFTFCRMEDGKPLVFGMYPTNNWTLIDVIC